MDILLRGIDRKYIKDIDKRCELISVKLNRKYTRAEYLRNLIQNDVEHSLLQFKQDKFDEAVGNVSVSLERQENKLQEYIDVTNEFIRLMGQRE
ncbi:hypothetical protein ACU80C_31550 (plasmid) [Bacillus mycoides]|jgi:hypothetical protein|uniref:Uncharacterized protein n=3 Tax=Bacillus cereus group TaxID=86661 RepID=R8NBL5_BACCX|nr:MULTISPECIES: hypothetical protein [Bacillus cereus group]PFK00666.1 hypothetical protein COI97_17470 [Bacillus cereus]EOP43900.1 hypothetical protein IK1_05610 [Bacillus cereus VD146]KMQ19205.1 hypothetical protein TU70_09240 [Bacillus mycoides]PJN57600.1 hypothetical protein BAWEI_54970 [Bacillus mycoides]PJN69649.1 hypothetical protein BACWE_34900 [Bacillus mycoides]